MNDTPTFDFPIERFTVYSLLGKKNYSLLVKDKASIIVGPNGSGKSHFLSILYLVLSRQWAKLTDYNFERIEITCNDYTISFLKEDILETASFLDSAPSRYRELYNYLFDNNKFGDFVSFDAMDYKMRKYYSDLFKLPSSSIATVQIKLREELNSNPNFLALDSFIEELELGPIIYMPTYRRIEKDLRNIIPSKNDYYEEISKPFNDYKDKKRFIEIVGAGMSDVRVLIESKIQNLRLEKQKVTEKAAQEYILDIIRGKIQGFSLNRLKNIEEESLIVFVESLDNSLFKKADKDNLKKQILGFRNKRARSAPNSQERYLGLYIEKLVQAHEEIKKLESPLRRLSELASNYIDSEKEFDFVTSSKFYTDEMLNEVDLDGLSSGEKQIIAMFSYLLLLDSQKCILIIDEPELSLSVPWQKKLLPDIISTNGCEHIFTVTHSPFIFDNELRSSLTDTQSMSVE